MDLATLFIEKEYAHSSDYERQLIGIEVMLQFTRGEREKTVLLLKQYESLIRQYGARTERSREILKAIAKDENRDIISTGNLLHLGNCIQADQKLQSSPGASRTLTVEELQTVLGIGRTKAYKLAKEPGFPSFKVGRRTLVYRDELTNWLAERSKKENGGDK